MALNVAQVLRALETLEGRANDLDATARANIRAELDVLRAASIALADDYDSLITVEPSSPAEAGTGEIAFMASSFRRLAHWKRGDLQSFHAMRPPTGEAGQNVSAGLLAFERAMEAAVEFQQLRLGVAAKLAREARFLEGRTRHPAPTHVFGTVVLAEVLHEQGEVVEAENLVRDHLQQVRNRGCAEVAIRLYPLLARIALHGRNGDLAMFLVRDGLSLGEVRGWDRLVAVCLREWVELLVHAGRLDEARMRHEEMEMRWCADDEVHDSGVGMALLRARCRVKVAGGQPLEAVATLTRLWQIAVASGDLYLSVQLQVHAAEALVACGRKAEAIEVLLAALEIGAGAGLHQSFVGAGPAVVRLLEDASDALAGDAKGRLFLQPYVSSMLGSCREARHDIRTARGVELRGPLSCREHTILKLMRYGSSNKRIAQELGIAPETVKSHAKRIFIKLGAQTRVEAVTRAASLSLF